MKNIDLKQTFADLAAQFEGLQGRHPGLWPLAPRLLCAAGVMAVVMGLGYFFYWSGQFEEQDACRGLQHGSEDRWHVLGSEVQRIPDGEAAPVPALAGRA